MDGEALSEKFSVAFSDPGGTEGVNLTVTVQLIPTEREFPLPAMHVVAVMIKSAAFVPVMPGLLLKVKDPLPEPQFVRVTVMELDDPNAN